MTRLVIGVGCSLGCADAELRALVDGALAAGLGVPLDTFPVAALAAIEVPTPSHVVAHHVGTPSVAEAAALLATRGELVITKRRSPHATCAIAKEH